MADDRKLRATYAQLRAASRVASAEGVFEVTYHALAAALHTAVALRDVERIAEIERVAGEQQRWIDTTAPTHPLSSANSKLRGGQNLWESLAHTARTQRHILHPWESVADADVTLTRQQSTDDQEQS